ncbi:hypothetical protein [Ralstonia pseudosolanacearum]|nr:hypothetical protein [Ralstonia pseudosolanacearum]
MIKRAMVLLVVACTLLTSCSRSGGDDAHHESEFKRKFLGEQQ